MIFVLVTEDGPRQVSGAFTAPLVQTYDVWGFPVPKVEMVTFPQGWLDSASDEELAAANISKLDDPPSAPAGKIIASQTLEVDQDGKPYWLTAYAKAPKPTPPAPVTRTVEGKITLPDGIEATVTFQLSAGQLAQLAGA
jgi:hypothetical protein